MTANAFGAGLARPDRALASRHESLKGLGGPAMLDSPPPLDLDASRHLLRGSRRAKGLQAAQSMIVAVVTQWWRSIAPDLAIAPPGPRVPAPRAEQIDIAEAIAIDAARLPVLDAGYRIGTVYTAMLPSEFRSKHGVFYTPPSLTMRLIDLASDAGVDWRKAKILDPACGGGAFLAPVAMRIAEAMSADGAAMTLDSIADRLEGWELDPVSAWISTVLLEAALLDPLRETGRRLYGMVDVRDSLEDATHADLEQAGYDLVIGNPPYGKVRLTDAMRQRYRRSLYGHANLYGLFTDLALRLTKPGGVIAYVTPTSFLGGEYFKALRALLAAEAPPMALDFVEDRRGVFADALQEAVLALYRKRAAR